MKVQELAPGQGGGVGEVHQLRRRGETSRPLKAQRDRTGPVEGDKRGFMWLGGTNYILSLASVISLHLIIHTSLSVRVNDTVQTMA